MHQQIQAWEQKVKEILSIYRLYYLTASNRTSWPTPPFSHRGLDLPSPFRAPGYHRSAIGDGATHLPAAPHAHPAKRCVCQRCGCCERRLQEQAVCHWSPAKLSRPHVHRNPTVTAGPRPRVAHRGLCPTDRPGAAVTARPRLRATHRGSCPVDRPRAAPQSRAIGGGPCPADIPATGPQPRAAPKGAGSVRFAHSSMRPPFRIWWGQCFGAWHRG